MTTTGFATADSEQWTASAQLVLILVMFLGGCTGSTSGAIKTFRWLVIGKVIVQRVRRFAQPQAVLPVRVGNQVIEHSIVLSVCTFGASYVFAAVIGMFALTAFGADSLTALSATAATLGGVGPGLGRVGPYDNYAWMPAGAKAVCMALMLLGRLEIYTLLVVLRRDFWRN